MKFIIYKKKKINFIISNLKSFHIIFIGISSFHVVSFLEVKNCYVVL